MPLTLEPHPKGGFQLKVVASPRASRDAILGEHDGALKLSVTAPPVGGAANKAICALVAKRLGVAKSSVEVVRGLGSRRKTLLIRGADETEILEKLGS